MYISVKEGIKRLRKISKRCWKNNIQSRSGWLRSTLFKVARHYQYLAGRSTQPALPIEVIMDTKYKSVPVKSSEITSHSQYLSRREFLRTAGILTGSALLAACSPGASAATNPPSASDMPDMPPKV